MIRFRNPRLHPGTNMSGEGTEFYRISPLNGHERQVIDMADAAVTLVRQGTGITNPLLKSSFLLVDPQSAGVSENLLLPPEADCADLVIYIFNTGGESIAIQNDAGGAILTLETGLAAVLACDGTTWRGMVGLAGDIQSANIADLAITEPKMARNLLKFTETNLNTADILALAGTNITVVANPGAGLAVVPVSAHLFMTHGGTDFIQVQGEDQLALRYAAGAEITELGTEAQCTALIEAAADAALFCPNLLTANPAGFVPVAATAIDLDNNGTTSPEYTTGDGDLSIRVYYREVTMASFGT